MIEDNNYNEEIIDTCVYYLVNIVNYIVLMFVYFVMYIINYIMQINNYIMNINYANMFVNFVVNIMNYVFDIINNILCNIMYTAFVITDYVNNYVVMHDMNTMYNILTIATGGMCMLMYFAHVLYFVIITLIEVVIVVLALIVKSRNSGKKLTLFFIIVTFVSSAGVRKTVAVSQTNYKDFKDILPRSLQNSSVLKGSCTNTIWIAPWCWSRTAPNSSR